MVRLGLALSLLASSSAFAQDRQYRTLELTDGRRINAEVLATEATGLRMRIPQGETLVSFELLVNIEPIEASDFDDQPPVRIWVHSEDKLDEATAVYASLPNTLVSSGQNANGLAPGLVVQLDQCGPDFTCLSDALADEDWMWLVTILPPPDESDAAYIWRGRGSGGPPITRRDQKVVSPDSFWRTGHEVLGLVATSNAPKTVREAFEASGTAIPTARDLRVRSTRGRTTAIGAAVGGVGLGLAGIAAVSLAKDEAPASYAQVGITAAAGLVVGALVGNSLGKSIVPEVAITPTGVRSGVVARW